MQITQERLKQLFDYDQDTGIFTRKITRANQRAGCVAGSFHQGYININVDRKVYRAHRIAWLYVFGSMPTKFIDHIDGDGTNNRISNLRDVSHAENLQNLTKARKDNRNGFLGTIFHKRLNKFEARIMTSGKTKYLGLFDTGELAHAAYLDAKRTLHRTCTL